MFFCFSGPSWGSSWSALRASFGPPSWAILAALVASQVRLGSHLGHLGRLGERQGRVLAPTEPRKEGAIHQTGCDPGGGGPLERLQKPYQTALGILARLNVPGGTVADDGKRAQTRRVARWTLVQARREIFINWGECRGGRVSRYLLHTPHADSPEWPFRLRHPHKMEMLEASVEDVLC